VTAVTDSHLVTRKHGQCAFRLTPCHEGLKPLLQLRQEVEELERPGTCLKSTRRQRLAHRVQRIGYGHSGAHKLTMSAALVDDAHRCDRYGQWISPLT
jgi:hypothetical protein